MMPRARKSDLRRPSFGWVTIGGFALIVAGGACGSSASSAPVRQPARSVVQTTKSEPSSSARMVCADEGRAEIAQTVGREIIRPLVGRWNDDTYSCDYVYTNDARMTLSVKQLSSRAEATTYLDKLGSRLGRMRALQGLGQGAYQATNGSTVVRKDNLVLVVDVTELPAMFGAPSSPRADVSLSVAATIMGCWTGA